MTNCREHSGKTRDFSPSFLLLRRFAPIVQSSTRNQCRVRSLLNTSVEPTCSVAGTITTKTSCPKCMGSGTRTSLTFKACPPPSSSSSNHMPFRQLLPSTECSTSFFSQHLKCIPVRGKFPQWISRQVSLMNSAHQYVAASLPHYAIRVGSSLRSGLLNGQLNSALFRWLLE